MAHVRRRHPLQQAVERKGTIASVVVARDVTTIENWSEILRVLFALDRQVRVVIDDGVRERLRDVGIDAALLSVAHDASALTPRPVRGGRVPRR